MATSRSKAKPDDVTARRKAATRPAVPVKRKTAAKARGPAGGNVIAFEAAAERFGLTKGQFAETLGISRDALYRPARLESAKNQSRIREALEIVERISGWAGGERPALSWYRSHAIPAFGGRTAEALVKDGKAALVRDYLDAVAVGSFA
jgi:hypothetical protein